MNMLVWTVPMCVLAAFAAGAFGYVLTTPPGRPAPPDSPDGHALYLTHCAGCHGASLEGQPNWKKRNADGRLPAPPHDETGHTWHHSDRQLFEITKYGPAVVAPGYESDMPGFGDVISDEEILVILAYIRSTWPDRQRDYQLERSNADP